MILLAPSGQGFIQDAIYQGFPVNLCMTVEIEESPLKYQFLEKIQSGDLQELHAFLDKQNISDVAELINEFPNMKVRYSEI